MISQATITVLAALLAFGVFHSLTAALGFKALFVEVLGKRAYLGLYRLLYNTVSLITLLPVLGLVAVEGGALVWSLEGALAVIFMAIQGIGALGLGISLLQIDGLRFLGIRQALAYFALEELPLPAEPLATGGVYALTRHPLYFFSLLFLWFNPRMSEGMLGLVIGSTLYFVLGSLLEEQKLRREFGADYRAYQQRVAWMIPFLKVSPPVMTESSERG